MYVMANSLDYFSRNVNKTAVFARSKAAATIYFMANFFAATI